MMVRSAFAVLLLLLPSLAAADTHGNIPSVATVLPGDTNPVVGNVDYDTDSDWFVFEAWPHVSYRMAVSTGSLWDAVLRLRAPDGEILIEETNTAWGQVDTVWSNDGVAADYYVEVQGLFEFTTGTYELVVGTTNAVDSDNDGMLDTWEWTVFGTLTNEAGGDVDADGLSNGLEFGLRSSPVSAQSGLRMTGVERSGDVRQVSWEAARYGAYRLSAATSLLETGWTVFPEQTHVSGTGTALQTVTNIAPGAFYRVYYVPR